MKSFIVILLCSLLLIEGCYSSLAVNTVGGPQKQPTEDEDIIITLKDGSQIESEPHHHIEVTEPSDFIYIIEGQLVKTSGESKSFSGPIHPTTFDSTVVETVMTSWTSQARQFLHYYTFKLSDGSSVRCEQKTDWFVASSKEGSGLWCVGQLESHGMTTTFIGRIPFENIKQVEVRKFSLVNTTLLVISIPSAVLLALIISGIVEGSKR